MEPPTSGSDRSHASWGAYEKRRQVFPSLETHMLLTSLALSVAGAEMFTLTLLVYANPLLIWTVPLGGVVSEVAGVTLVTAAYASTIVPVTVQPNVSGAALPVAIRADRVCVALSVGLREATSAVAPVT